MVLKILPVTAGDMSRVAIIERAAYEPLETNRILFFGPFPANVLEMRAGDLSKMLEDPNTTCCKVVDTDLEGDEQLISFAKWVTHVNSPPARPRVTREWPPGTNTEACELLFGGLAEVTARLMGGKPHVYLQMLHTDPKHQGRGAGSMLTEKCIGEANKRGLPTYLESSEGGHSLYLKYFRDVEEFTVDMSKWGATKPHRTWAMIHDPE